MAMSSGINFHGFGNFIIPLSREFGGAGRWCRGFSQSPIRIRVFGPFEGWAVDRIGPRKLMVVGIPLMGIGFILLSQVRGLISFLMYTFWE
ncbi:MAG: hypothetical protein CM1200mP3_15740 [Chloroflexota bacterium]|nr:MAG: hypothetical protein CM1200mP3_15740 [Chloroflexota bacterium]